MLCCATLKWRSGHTKRKPKIRSIYPNQEKNSKKSCFLVGWCVVSFSFWKKFAWKIMWTECQLNFNVASAKKVPKNQKKVIFVIRYLIFFILFSLFDSYVRSSIFDFRFSIFDFRVSIFEFRFSVFEFWFSISDFRVSIFDFRVSSFEFRFSSFDFRFSIIHVTFVFLIFGSSLLPFTYFRHYIFREILKKKEENSVK